jgi:hypothetical protein
MTPATILMPIAPSMLVSGPVVFGPGVRHGEFHAGRESDGSDPSI